MTEYPFNVSLNASASHYGLELHTQLVGKFATLGQEFERHFLNRGLIYFAIYKYVIHSALSNSVAVQQFFY